MWEDDEDFVYTFNADGTGMMNAFGEISEFTWMIIGTDNLRITFGTTMVSWAYEIYQDILVIENMQLAGVAYGYFRVSDEASIQGEIS